MVSYGSRKNSDQKTAEAVKSCGPFPQADAGVFTYSNIFPADIIALTTLKDMDFFFHPGQNDLTGKQKEYLSRAAGVPLSSVANIRQVHGKKVIVATPDYVAQGIAEEADALITNTPGLPVIIRTADCVPLFLCDSVKRCIGVVHAGWKSTQLNIAQEAISQMRSAWGTDPKDIRAALGPSILRCCYEVEKKFYEYFPGFVENINGRYTLDLPAVNKKQLVDAGVVAGNIFDSQECTFCAGAGKYFSFRKGDATSGRMVSLMMIKQ
jgi:YfiH family protein